MARPGGWASPVTRNRPYAGAENLGAACLAIASPLSRPMKPRPMGLGGGGASSGGGA